MLFVRYKIKGIPHFLLEIINFKCKTALDQFNKLKVNTP